MITYLKTFLDNLKSRICQSIKNAADFTTNLVPTKMQLHLYAEHTFCKSCFSIALTVGAGVTIKYLGRSSIFNNLLTEKGRKAFFKIKKSVELNKPCSLLEKLFDTLVQVAPVIVCCSEFTL